MKPKEKGIVYIFTNPSMPDWIKIGKTDKSDIPERLKELNSSSAVPLSFRAYAILHTDNAIILEKKIHNIIDHIAPSLRSREQSENGRERVREFFQISPERAYMLFKDIANSNDTLVLCAPTKKEQEEEKTIKQKRIKTTFKLLNIPIGAELSFIKDEQIKCTVKNAANLVEYNGKGYSLSALAKELLGWDSVQGASYFTYAGETLWDRRLRLESED